MVLLYFQVQVIQLSIVKTPLIWNQSSFLRFYCLRLISNPDSKRIKPRKGGLIRDQRGFDSALAKILHWMFFHRYYKSCCSHLPNEQERLNKRAGVQFNQKIINGQGNNMPNIRAGVHVLSNDDNSAVVQVCLIKGMGPNVPEKWAERLKLK